MTNVNFYIESDVDMIDTLIYSVLFNWSKHYLFKPDKINDQHMPSHIAIVNSVFINAG